MFSDGFYGEGMSIDRRKFLISAAAASAGAGSVTSASIHAQRYGAVGDGVTNDTGALQRAIDEAGEGGTVRLRRGAVYRVDANAAPTQDAFGGLKLRAGQTLDLNGAELKALPSSHGQSVVVQAHGVNGWRIVGPGRITGERDVHRGVGGEWGFGVAAFGSSDWRIEPGVHISNCWGDGLYIGRQENGTHFCERFIVDGIEVSNCRRNGITVTAGRDGEIRRVKIYKIGGTSPEGAIDLEPDERHLPNRNIIIRDGRIYDSAVGIYATVANQNVLISGMRISASNSGILFSDNLDGLRIVRNPRIESTSGGKEGGAIRTVTGNPGGINNVVISHNGLHGGGFFVIDIFGRGYRNLVVAHNSIYASNPDVRGVARLGTSRFTDNVCVVEANAGFEGEWLVIFDNVTHGRNHYRNLSSFNLPPLLRDESRDIGGNIFAPFKPR